MLNPSLWPEVSKRWGGALWGVYGPKDKGPGLPQDQCALGWGKAGENEKRLRAVMGTDH